MIFGVTNSNRTRKIAFFAEAFIILGLSFTMVMTFF